MYSWEIKNILLNDHVVRRQFGGIYAADTAPETFSRRPVFFVINTDKHDQPGKHWVLMYFPKTGYPEFFDSFGREPSFYTRRFRRVLLTRSRRFGYNNVQIQQSGTFTCAHFCIYYLYFRCRGLQMNSIINSFNKLNLHANELKVTNFVNMLQM